MSNSEKVIYWVELAEYDLVTAQAMLDTRRYLYVGFMCHQAIEKVLKAAFVTNKKENPPYTHNLSILAKESTIYALLSDKQKDLLDLLDPLNIEARYPTYKDQIFRSLSKEKCVEILRATKELQQWIKEKLLKK
jgi:HEPN domain-containing protein